MAVLLFAIAGLPLWAVMLLGERSCDMHVGPPCAISWGWMKLLGLAAIVAICALIGWLAGLLSRLSKRGGEDSSDGV